jgi:hypothetical protein
LLLVLWGVVRHCRQLPASPHALPAGCCRLCWRLCHQSRGVTPAAWAGGARLWVCRRKPAHTWVWHASVP